MRTLLFMLFVTTVETQISTTKDASQLRSVLPSKAPEDAGIQGKSNGLPGKEKKHKVSIKIYAFVFMAGSRSSFSKQ